LKILVGQIKRDTNSGYKNLAGMTIAGTQLYEDDNELCALQPLTLEDMERFYKSSYEGLKNDISEDYDYCIRYLLDGNCEFVSSMPLDTLKNIREYTKADDEIYAKNIKEFKKRHNFYEIDKALKNEEEVQKKANEKFDKLPKEKITVPIINGNETVDAVTYKGFAVHYPLKCKGSKYKAVTAIDGEYKGLLLTECKTTEYKNLIDEVRKAIGDRPPRESDKEKLIEIVKKY
jgi:hypothetical protein